MASTLSCSHASCLTRRSPGQPNPIKLTWYVATRAPRSNGQLASLRTSPSARPRAIEDSAASTAPVEEIPRSPSAPLEEDPVLRARQLAKAEWAPPKMSLGETILDVLYVFGGLLDRPFGSGQSMAAAGVVVVERVRSEIGAVLPQGSAAPGGVAGGALPSALEQKQVQTCFEILRVMQLLSVDLELMRAAVREETLLPRLEAAKAKCRDAMALARTL